MIPIMVIMISTVVLIAPTMVPTMMDMTIIHATDNNSNDVDNDLWLMTMTMTVMVTIETMVDSTNHSWVVVR